MPCRATRGQLKAESRVRGTAGEPFCDFVGNEWAKQGKSSLNFIGLWAVLTAPSCQMHSPGVTREV